LFSFSPADTCRLLCTSLRNEYSQQDLIEESPNKP
jgi:hypothetical protein